MVGVVVNVNVVLLEQEAGYIRQVEAVAAFQLPVGLNLNGGVGALVDQLVGAAQEGVRVTEA
ncbi:MAG: hypothetical protein JWR37_4297 [Mycobacterium sp.]|nr:hypothetical protein [Mycobacterium sp.]